MKKLLAVLLVITLMIATAPMGALSISVSAVSEDMFWYNVSDDGVIITGFKDHLDGDVVLPSTIGGSPVVGIGDSAFAWYNGITSITIPDSVTSIGDDAFYNCDSLTSVSIGDSVTSIGDRAFCDCDSLTSVIIPDSVTSIGGWAFEYCDSLTSVTIGDSVTSIGYFAFSSCTSLTSITIPDSVTSIGDGAFSSCTSLTSITIPDSVTSIGDGAFSSCTSLISITIPDSVTSIDDLAFANCSSLTSITIPDSVTSIGDWAFSCCSSLTDVTFLNTCVTIGNSAFESCWYLYDVYCSGSKEETANMVIGENNSYLINATWHYNTCDGEHSYNTEITLQCSNCDYKRNIIEILDRLEIDDVTLVEGVDTITVTYGYWEGDKYIEEKGFQYDYSPSYTVYLIDGTELKSSTDFIMYENEWFSFQKSDDQSSENVWGEGTYQAKGSIMGLTDTFNVTITESPYESIEILSSEPVKETDFSWVDSYGNKRYYVPNFTYKITYKDGTTVTREYDDGSRFDGLYIETSSNQSEDTPWTVGGENNKAIVMFAGLTAEFNVTMVEGDDWEYVEQDGSLFITNCYLSDSEITVPETIDGKPVIGIMAFGKCMSYAKVINIPDCITYISEEAFGHAWGLQTVNVGKGTSNLSPNMFTKCTNLTAVNVSAENENYTSVDGTVYNKSGDTLVVYPLGKGETYTIPDNVVNIDVIYTEPCYSDINVVGGENCKAFKTVEGVTYNLDMTVVVSCNDEKTGTYIMPETVTKIARNAFKNSNLSEITVSNSVTDITYAAFADCNNLETINMPNTITSIGDYAFADSNIKNLEELPKELKTIGSAAFANTQLQKVTEIPANLEEMGPRSFYNTQLETLFIPNTVADIAYGYPDSVFANNINLKNITLPNSLTSIPFYMFEGCENLTEIEIPDGVYGIEYSAFYGCANLEKIVIPSSVEYIDYSSFVGCDKLTIYAPEGSYAQTYANNHGIPFVVYEKPTYAAGDLSGDEKINNKDLGLLMQKLNGWVVSINEDAADVNADGKVNNKDYGLLMQYCNGWDVELK